jgi:GDPmannose 4,6-dehydratase
MQECLYLGNMNSLRDWGHARDYVEAQWLMMQQDRPEDYVIATGEQHSVREFVTLAAKKLGFTISWSGTGVEEVGVVNDVSGAVLVKPGQVIVKINPVYYRPTEVDTLLGDPGKAKADLNWTPKVSFEELVVEMVQADLLAAQKDDLCRQQGYQVFDCYE